MCPTSAATKCPIGYRRGTGPRPQQERVSSVPPRARAGKREFRALRPAVDAGMVGGTREQANVPADGWPAERVAPPPDLLPHRQPAGGGRAVVLKGRFKKSLFFTCLWTRRRVHRRFADGHVTPFSLGFCANAAGPTYAEFCGAHVCGKAPGI